MESTAEIPLEVPGSGPEPRPAAPPEDRERPWTRGQRLTLAALVAAMLASLYWTVHPWYDQANDAALYVLTGRSIAAGEGYSYLGVPFIIRPPGFSLLLAPLAAYPTDFLLLNTLVSLSGVLCVALMFAFYRPRLGTPVSAGLCVFVWLNPIFQELCTQVLSDIPGSAFVFGALLVERAARRRPTLGRHVALGLIIAAGLYIRSVCMLLIPAVLLARFAEHFFGARSERTRAALRCVWPALAVPILAWMPWSLRDARADVPVPPEHVFLHSYSTAMWHADPGNPGSPKLSIAEVLARIPVRLGEMLPLLGAGYREDLALADGVAIGISALVILCATVVLIRRREPAEFLFGGVLMVLAIYFAFKSRLALTLFLLGPPAVCEVVLRLTKGWSPRGVAAAALALLLAVPSALAFDPQAGRGAIEGAASERARLIRFLDKRLPPGAPVAMPTAWHVGVETDRPIYGLRVTVERQDTMEALALIDRYGIVAVATNNRQRDGVEYGEVLAQLYERHFVVGNWSVFFTQP